MKIGIHGLAGAGKDTLADALVKQLGGFCKESFANPLKYMCASYCGGLPYFGNKIEKETEYTVDSLHFDFTTPTLVPKELVDILCKYFLDIKENRKTITAREILQYVGTDIFRKFDQDFWVKTITDNTDNLILADLRFENELRAVDYSIKVVGGISSLNNFSSHASEKELHDELFDLVIHNKFCNTKEELNTQLQNHIDMIIKGMCNG